MVNKFEITYSSEGFSNLAEWWVSYDDSVITWRPAEPFLFAIDGYAQSIVASALAILQHHAAYGETFIAAHPGVYLPSSASNPHAALCVLNVVAPFEAPDDEDFEDGIMREANQPVVKFSRNAPKLIAIFGPSHDKYGNQIIY